MKLLHISDLHLGKRLGEYRLLEEQAALLRWVIETAQTHHVQGILLAGDIYDRSVPPVEAVALLDRFLTRLCAEKIPLFAISGNHDSPERIAFGSELFEKSGIYFSPVYDGQIRTIPLEEDGERVYIHLLPFLRPTHVRMALGLESPEAETDEPTLHGMTYTEAMAEVLDRLTLPQNGKNILVCHQFLTGALRSDSEEVPLVGTLDAIDVSLLDRFDYVALGHLHRAQTVGGREQVRYSGTLMPYAFSETEEKGCILVDTTEGIHTTFLPVPAGLTHTLATIEGSYDTLCRLDYRESCPHREDYLKIILEEDTPVPDAMAKLSTVYPRVVQLQYKGQGGNVLPESMDGAMDESRDETLSPDAVFAAFFEKQNGIPLSEEDKNTICALLAEEGEEPCDL